MKSNGHLKLPNLVRMVTSPKRCVALITKRLFPIKVLLECPEAYHTVGSFTFGCAPRVPLSQIFPNIESVGVTIQRAFDRDPNVSVDYHEILALSAIVKHTRATNILEIGTANGNTTLNLAENCPANGAVTTIDLPSNWDGQFAVEVPEYMINNTTADRVGNQYKASVQSRKVTQMLCDSAKLHWERMRVPFDLAFIDGCHHYNYVKIDTENAMRYVKPGGIILWHDYGIIEDVSRAVDEYQQTLKVSVVRGTTLAVGFTPTI